MTFLKNALAYSGTNIISQVVVFLQAFILRALLSPNVMGMWNLVQVVRSYVAPISLGAINGAFRELPILKGQGRKHEEYVCRSVSFTISQAEAILLSIGIVGYSLWRYGVYSNKIWLFSVAAALVMSTRLNETYTTFFQGAQLYIPLSRILLINSIIYAFILPIGALSAGITGLMASAIIAQFIKVLWMIYSGRSLQLKTKIGWDKDVMKRLVSFGMAYRLTDYPLTLFLMLDLLWITKFMDVGALAIYATARSISHQAFDITTRIGTVFYTRVLENFGEAITKKKIADDYRKFLQMQLLVCFPLVCWIVLITIPFMVRQVIPKYIDCLSLILPLMLSGFFIPQNNHLFAVWMAENKLKRYGKSNIVALMLTLILLVTFWYGFKWRQLVCIASAMLLGNIVHFAYMMVCVGRRLFGNKGAAKVFILVVLGAGWTGIALSFLVLQPDGGLGIVQDIALTLKGAMWALLALVPLIAYGLWSSDSGKIINSQLKISKPAE